MALGLCAAPSHAAPPTTVPTPAAERPRFHPRTALTAVPPGPLVDAVARGDRAEISRLAERLGPARLEALLASEDRTVARAALEATATLEGNVRLLGAVTRLVGTPAGPLAERAAQVLGAMLGPEDPRKLDDYETPPDEVNRACATLAAAAMAHLDSVPVRVAALEALAEAHMVCAESHGLAVLTDDVWPEVRRALLLSPRAAQIRPPAEMAALTRDPVPKVAGAAGALWCRQHVASLRKGPMAADLRRRLAQLRTLVLIEDTPPEDAIDMLPCLALSPEPEDQRALEILRKRRASPVSDRARELGGDKSRD